MGLAAAVLLSGCVNFKYEGESLPPGETPSVYVAGKLPANAKKLGRAVASGDYQSCPPDRLKEKLLAEAAAHGANAVVITAVQVVPKGSSVEPSIVRNAYEATGSTDSGNLNQMSRDFDGGGYGQADMNRPWLTPEAKNRVPNYLRVMRAEYYRLPENVPPVPKAQ